MEHDTAKRGLYTPVESQLDTAAVCGAVLCFVSVSSDQMNHAATCTLVKHSGNTVPTLTRLRYHFTILYIYIYVCVCVCVYVCMIVRVNSGCFHKQHFSLCL
jgi:hypothetical protein